MEDPYELLLNNDDHSSGNEAIDDDDNDYLDEDSIDRTSSQTFCTDSDDRIMFHKSGQTVRDVMEMIVAYSLKFGNSHEARHILLEMLKIYAGPEFQDLNISNYKLAQVFDPPSEKINFHFYCDKCTTKIFSSHKNNIKNQKLLCNVCKDEHYVSLSNPNSFVTVDLEYQLLLLMNNNEIADFFNPRNKQFINANISNTVLRDVQDSALHKEKIPSHSNTISYIISTDGAPLFNVSKRGFWPLQPVLQNRLQINGYYGCSYCYHGGLHVKGNGLKYPFLENEPEIRPHASHMSDVQKVKEKDGTSIRGVKGESAFNEICTIDMVWGFPMHYMHNALLGVTEQIWNNWNIILKPSQRKSIDELLKMIQPPRDLQRIPEPISSKSIYKATHWKSWMLYFCLTTCSTLIPTALLEHFALFVNSMFTVLQMEISEDELKVCEESLLLFVAKYEELYGMECMTFNVHIVQHLIESIRKSGPAWSTSAFPFENNIYTLKKRVNGPKSIEQQMTKKSLSALKYRLRESENNVSQEAAHFCKTIFSSKMYTKSAVTAGDITFFGPNPKNIFQSNTDKEFERCIYKKCVYSSVQYTRSKKWNDSVIYLQNVRKCKSVRQLIVKPFYASRTLVSHIWEVMKNVEHASVTVEDIISKAVVLEFVDTQYVCNIPNVIEAQ